MTPLRRRMTEDLQLRGYSDRTVEAYIRAVAQLARFYGKSPERLTEEEVRHYLVDLNTVQKVARGTHTIALCGIKFFYEKTLARKWTVLGLEAGVNLRLIQEYLGHSSPRTTAVYTHLTREIRDTAVDPINRLMQRL